MKKLLLTITTLFLGLFTIASCDINKPKPDKAKETETTQGNENKENKVEDKEKEKEKENTENKVEDKEKEKEKENTENKVEDKEKENTEDKDKEKEPSTNDNGTTSNDGTTSNGEQPSTSDNKQEEPTTNDNGTTSNDGTTSNEVSTGESGTNESGSSESGITSDGRPTPEETARFLAFNTKRVEIRKRLENDSALDNSKEGIELARTIAPNYDMRYKTDLWGRPVDEFYLLIGTIERNKLRATSALIYGWERINEERYTRHYDD